MKNLRMDLDQLRIDSFHTTAALARESQRADHAITQGAQTCYDCTRFGCPGTALC